MSERGIPTPAELAQALREFLTDGVMAQTTGALRFHARVAANVAGIIEREITLGPGYAQAHRERLAALGMADDAQLAAAIRNGDMDGRDGELRAALLASTIERLEIANPRYLDPRHQPTHGGGN